ncbi:hypothetical protein FQR65_LT06349 [Abscondita terminalis]|nr:hypothetical protein FQR65_LT06349 [Abscondita terminalis]
MMGLQGITGKRKLEAAVAPGELSPAKNGRWEAQDCIARLQAVAVPSDTWRSPTPSLTATLLTDDFEDDDDFEDELSDDDKCPGVPEPARYPQYPRYPPDYWQYYQPPQQQTIRCEENGKSYLELGAAPPQRTRCCDGRTRWCHIPCYRQRRLAVLNLSMCKLARYRQCSDPSLRRSVLICNTLRRLEREMETDPPEPNYSSLPELSPPSRISPVIPDPSYEQTLREMTCSSGRATPFPSTLPDTDSGIGDDEMTKPINWGSVLSLTAQTDLEPLNNNELYAELGLSNDMTQEWKEPSTSRSEDWDGFMHVLVGIMGPRGKHFKRNKGNPRFQKFRKGKSTQKKTYSIYQKPNSNSKKRNFSSSQSERTKRQKTEDIEVKEPEINENSSSSEEEDNLNQLLQTFDCKTISKQSLAVNSSDDSEEDVNEDESNDGSLSEDEISLVDEEKDKLNGEIEEENKIDEVSTDKDQDLVEKDEVDAETQKEDDNKLADLHDPFAKHLFYELSESLLQSLQSVPSIVTNHSIDWPCLGKLQIKITKGEEQQIIDSTCGIIEKKRFASPGRIPTHLTPEQCTFESFHIKSQLVNNISGANKTKVLHHNARLTKKDDVPEEYRDQGLVRPKVLIVVPFRNSAYRIISTIIDILISEDNGNVLNRNRFLEEFTGHELALPKKNPKPEDYEKLFAGNTGDDFRIGLTITKKSLKLFANFYSSDIIVASPLGLRTIIGAEGETDRDFDFLASIELLVLDQTELFLMQNWDHIFHLFNHLHLQPKESHGTDFSRVRTWSLNGWAKYYRQTLIFSSVTLPEINTIFNKKCFNYAGKVKCIKNISLGSICQVFNQLPHVFQKFNANSVSQSIDARFNFFIDKVLPQQREILMRQTLIYISNYFDYVKLRNHFKKEDIGFVQICEYSKEGKIARARDMFFHGDAHFLLYTERYHFFNRIKIKGIRHIIFYQPPIFPHFYYEMCNLMQEANMNKKIGSSSNMTVTVLYSHYDLNQISEIVGTDRAARMLHSDRNVHMLVTDAK